MPYSTVHTGVVQTAHSAIQVVVISDFIQNAAEIGQF